MNILNYLRSCGAVLWTFVAFISTNVVGVEIQGFPEACAEANLRTPLVGHILRAGRIYWNSSLEGWSFGFPDHSDSQGLQSAEVAQNAGVIGQNYGFGSGTIDATPDDSFVIAQILIDDPNSEPVVTCLSEALPITRFDPEYYLGSDWAWLASDVFAERLRWKRFYRWDWDDYFHRHEHEYGRFKEEHRHRHFERRHREEHLGQGHEGRPTGEKAISPHVPEGPAPGHHEGRPTEEKAISPHRPEGPAPGHHEGRPTEEKAISPHVPEGPAPGHHVPAGERQIHPHVTEAPVHSHPIQRPTGERQNRSHVPQVPVHAAPERVVHHPGK